MGGGQHDGNGSGNGGGGYGGGREFGPNGDLFFSTHKKTTDPEVPGGSFVSFGSKEADGYHKTSVVYDADMNVHKSGKVGGGAFNGGFWSHVAGKVTK